jgi:hypothetical protein
LSASASPSGLERLELRVPRLDLTFRFTFAFHAREVRFERDAGDGFERVFPETFSFRAGQHDPTELLLQLDDLLGQSRLLGGGANRRDAKQLMERLVAAAPSYIERICEQLEASESLSGPMRLRFHQDTALLSQIFLRFLETRDFDASRPMRNAGFMLRRRIHRSLQVLVNERVSPEYLSRYIAGEVDPIDPSDDPTESGFFFSMETGSTEVVDRMIVRMASRAFYQWLEGVCLDEENQAFEKGDSRFADREAEVLAAITRPGADGILRGADITPFLHRSDRDCVRLLGKLERWFLRQYDIRHSSAIIRHASSIERGFSDVDEILTWHTPRIHALALTGLFLPFIGATFFYEQAPRFFDLACTAEILFVNAVAIWFLLYRFCWKRDLSFFYASVPRIGAGIIVGYLPVFLIDEVWDLASRPAWVIASLVTFLALVTLLYIYVEVRHRLGDATVAFGRARALFLMGVMQAAGVGLVMTSLVGRFMVSRNWAPLAQDATASSLAGRYEPFIGALPRIVGYEPFYAFPSALLLMIFLSFFIGVFLQLMWEELPITEPL